MTRKWIVPAVVMAVWIAGLYAIDPLTDGDLGVYVFVAYTLAAGALANRWWVLIVPFTVMAGLFTYDETNPCSECRDELAGLGQLFLGMLLAAAAAIPLALGIGLRRIAALVRRRYPSRARNAL